MRRRSRHFPRNDRTSNFNERIHNFVTFSGEPKCESRSPTTTAAAGGGEEGGERGRKES